jgi:O-antigen biosynthesis protein WbqP
MYKRLKRLLDIFLACIVLLLTWPIFILISICIRLDSTGPVFFKQKRIGIHKKYFYILKFRTMRTDTPQNMPTHLLSNPDEAITRIGRFLRKSSLDELPQIFNILKGEMSFIGPRPALWNQFDLIEERDLYKANSIYPGLTGWAQINGRDELPIKDKAKFDGEYLKKMSLIFDIKIIFKTVSNVVRSEGVKEGMTQTNK